MKHLILSGGGNIDQTEIVDRFYFSLLPKNPKILYLPFAWDKDDDYAGCLAWFCKLMSKYDIMDYVMWREAVDKKLDDLMEFDSVYIGGGNTFKLLYELRESGLMELLRQYIQTGRPVYGGSAGAIVLGRDIASAGFGYKPDQNLPGLTDLSGLNLVDGLVVQCHYSPDQAAETSAWVEAHKMAVTALKEGGGLHVTDSGLQPLGQEPTVFQPTR